MKFFIVITLFIAFIFATQLKLINRPILENDEGIYLTTFHLINSSHPAYKETFLSQPPGFLLSVYPGYLLFGKTLAGTRLAIGLWSLIGILAIVWLSIEIGSKWSSLLIISILYLIPYYSNQTTTLQSDILVTTFSLLSLASLVRFRKKSNIKWFIISIFFLNLSFWTKFDISLIPSFLIILFIVKKRRYLFFCNLLGPPVGVRRQKNTVSSLLLNILFFSTTFLVICLIFFLIFIFPFGIKDVFNNVVNLRLQAVSFYQPSLSNLINLIKANNILLFVFIASIICAVFRKKSFRYPFFIILIWSISSLILFSFYRPLFPHHLALLSLPFVLFFSYSLTELLKKYKIFYYWILVTFISTSIINFLSFTVKTKTGILNKEQKQAIEIINKYTNKNDIVVSDEEILNGVSGRLPPPKLSDISYVRVLSNNLSTQEFTNQINLYKPKLIISWNGRLQSIKNFDQIIKSYKELTTINQTKKIYILNN